MLKAGSQEHPLGNYDSVLGQTHLSKETMGRQEQGSSLCFRPISWVLTPIAEPAVWLSSHGDLVLRSILARSSETVQIAYRYK